MPALDRADVPAALEDGSRLLHIGLPKTGTSALQASLHAARAPLAAAGVELVSSSANPLAAARWAAGWTDAPQAAELERRWRALAGAFAGSSARIALLSSEGLSGATPPRIDLIADQLGAERTRVAITLRPRAALLPSNWQQGLRRGETSSFDDWLREVLEPGSAYERAMDRYQPETLIREWGSRFGEDNLIFVIGHPTDRMYNHRVFEALLGVADVLELQPVQNASPAYAEVEMMRHFNLANGRGGAEAEVWTKVMRKAGRRMGDTPPPGGGTQKVRVPQWAAERTNEQAAVSIAALEQSGATVVGDLRHLLVDTDEHGADGTAPDRVTAESAGWFAETVARLAVEEFTQARRREQRQPRQAPQQRAVPDASARELLTEIGRRLRGRGR